MPLMSQDLYPRHTDASTIHSLAPKRSARDPILEPSKRQKTPCHADNTIFFAGSSLTKGIAEVPSLNASTVILK